MPVITGLRRTTSRFPEFIARASLKPAWTALLAVAVVAVLSRVHCSGLIEATNIVFNPATVETLSRVHCSGLIEAVRISRYRKRLALLSRVHCSGLIEAMIEQEHLQNAVNAFPSSLLGPH